LKRWTGVSVGWVLSSEIACFGEPTASDGKEGNNAAHDNASAARPCGVRDPRHAEKLHAREPGDPVAARGQLAGRGEKAMSHKSLMHGNGESSGRIVPTKSANKGGGPQAEQVEGRRSAKEIPRHGPLLDTVPENTRAIQCRREHVQSHRAWACLSPRWEPCALVARARVCAGGSGQPLSLPRLNPGNRGLSSHARITARFWAPLDQ
jgi:hypothetical protein